MEHVDSALGKARAEHLRASILAFAARRCDPQHVEPILLRAAHLRRGRQRVYNAAVEAIAFDRHAERRMDRAVALVDRMRDEGVRPSNYTLQHVFAAARDGATSLTELLDLLSSQMQRGIRPSRAAFDELLRAASAGGASGTSGGGGPVQLGVQVLEACSFRPSGQTVRGLARLVRTADDAAVLEQVLVALPPKPRRAPHEQGSKFACAARRANKRARKKGQLA